MGGGLSLAALPAASSLVMCVSDGKGEAVGGGVAGGGALAGESMGFVRELPTKAAEGGGGESICGTMLTGIRALIDAAICASGSDGDGSGGDGDGSDGSDGGSDCRSDGGGSDGGGSAGALGRVAVEVSPSGGALGPTTADPPDRPRHCMEHCAGSSCAWAAWWSSP